MTATPSLAGAGLLEYGQFHGSGSLIPSVSGRPGEFLQKVAECTGPLIAKLALFLRKFTIRRPQKQTRLLKAALETNKIRDSQ